MNTAKKKKELKLTTNGMKNVGAAIVVCPP